MAGVAEAGVRPPVGSLPPGLGFSPPGGCGVPTPGTPAGATVPQGRILFSSAQSHSHSPWSLPPLRRGTNEACYSRCPKRQWGRLDRICPSHTRVLRRAGSHGGRSALLQGSPGDLESCCLVSLSSQGCHPNVHNHSLYLFSTLRVKGEGTTRLLVRMSPRPCTWHCRMQVAVSAMSSPSPPSFLTHPLPHPRGPPEANVGPPNPGCQRGPEAL